MTLFTKVIIKTLYALQHQKKFYQKHKEASLYTVLKKFNSICLSFLKVL